VTLAPERFGGYEDGVVAPPDADLPSSLDDPSIVADVPARVE
jgi:hypothetical protein